MKRVLLPLFVLLLCGGCSRSQPLPQNPPTPSAGVFETTSQINEEIARRFPEKSTNADNFAVVLGILDNATNSKTVQGVRGWANDTRKMANEIQGLSTARAQAGENACKWVIAACDAKKGQLIGQGVNTDYTTAKKNALSEAARADSLTPS